MTSQNMTSKPANHIYLKKFQYILE